VKRARFVSVAAHEFLAELKYYEEARPGHGARFIAAVRQATARALAFPLSGSPAAAGTRRVLVRDFPFSIVYRVDAEGIVVFAVAHTARRPGYWRSRSSE
jgi:toxin ParE1/3/4